ncbi:MAG TPA: TIM barrel protein [Acidimicrobiales bacterium]|nr:TIM barrel protein [Acidimicrobiales bacterium]
MTTTSHTTSADPGLSCTSLSFPALGLEQVAGLMGVLGFSCVDLCIAEGSRDVQAAAVWEDPPLIAAEHRRLLEYSQLTVADVFAHIGRSALDRPINTADPDTRRENRRRLRSYFTYAAGVGSPGLTMSPGADGDAAAWERACSELAWAVQEAADHGLSLSVEAHLNSIAATVGAAAALCAAVPGLHLTIDYSHFLASGVAQAEVDPLFGYARHAHVRQSRPGDLQCPVDDGALDVRAMLAAAAAAGYTGRYSVEFVHSTAWNMNSLDVLTETVQMRAALLNAAASVAQPSTEPVKSGGHAGV